MSIVKETTFSNSEVMYYLEEVITMGVEDSVELNTYNELKDNGFTSKSNYYYVIEKMRQLYNEKF